jgi:hypothetical protein
MSIAHNPFLDADAARLSPFSTFLVAAPIPGSDLDISNGFPVNPSVAEFTTPPMRRTSVIVAVVNESILAIIVDESILAIIVDESTLAKLILKFVLIFSDKSL